MSSSISVKSYIYAEDGSLLGYIACIESPPEIVELGGRYFKKSHEVNQEESIGDFEIISYNYFEVDVEDEVAQLNFIEICVACGRNASATWWKCCPEHCTLDGPDVFCQSCVEILHHGEEEFERD